MERRQQERLVGAVVVAVAAAVVVPWLLDGSPERWAAAGRQQPLEPARMQRHQIDLGKPASAPAVAQPTPIREAQAEAPPAQVATPTAEPVEELPATTAANTVSDRKEADGDSPEPPVAEPSRVSQPLSQTAPTPGPPSPAVDAPLSDAPAPAGVDTGWSVQVGSFRDKGNAQGLVDTLTRKGYRAFLSRHTRNGVVWYRVRVGTEQTRAAALDVAARLRRDGQVAAPVRHP
ncbi:MAG: SPOR domain-containing protein [Pseudomonadota bacterium]